MSRKVIEGVPRLAQFLPDGVMMLTPFVGSLWAALQGMGRPTPYSDILALSGAGNRLAWRVGEWDGGNVDILSVEDQPFAPHWRALKALGLRGELKMARAPAGPDWSTADEAQARADIAASIDAGIPVIAMGIIGPPECCVVFGYEDEGDALVGWNYFQAEQGFSADAPFVKRDWFEGLVGYMLLSPGEAMGERERALAAFRAIVDHAHHADVRGRKVGLAAWASLADDLEFASFDDCVQVMFPEMNGADWPDWIWPRTNQGRFYVYCDALCQVAERGVALPFYERLAETYPEWKEPLTEAIAAWNACKDYGGFLWNHVTMDEAGFIKFADPAIRKILADECRRAMELDRKAISAVQRLLDAENG